jgi:hypothetical protein
VRARGVIPICILDRAMGDGRREKNSFAPHDRGRVALAGDGPLPSNVLLLAPLDGRVAAWSDARAQRPPPLRSLVARIQFAFGSRGRKLKHTQDDGENADSLHDSLPTEGSVGNRMPQARCAR